MAHPTDYASHLNISFGPISRLKRSPSIMNPNPQSPIPPNSHTLESHAYILTLNFLRNNSNWSIDSIFSYCLLQYQEFNITPMIISHAIKTFIDEKFVAC